MLTPHSYMYMYMYMYHVHARVHMCNMYNMYMY